MSTPTQQVRSLIQDKPLFVEDTFVTVDEQTVVQLKYFPVVAGSVIITDAAGAFTLSDPENGVITFAAAPAADVYAVSYSYTLLSDATIQDIMDVENNDPSGGADTEDVRIIAADCLDAIASQQALILKRIKLLDLELDGPAVAKSLQAHAKNLRELVYSQQSQESAFDVAEEINDLPGWKEKITKDWMRQES